MSRKKKKKLKASVSYTDEALIEIVAEKIQRIANDYDLTLVTQIYNPDISVSAVIYHFNKENCPLEKSYNCFRMNPEGINDENAPAMLKSVMVFLFMLSEVSEMHKKLAEETIAHMNDLIKESKKSALASCTTGNVVQLHSDNDG